MTSKDDGQEIQMLPAPTDLLRVETGAVQFGDDWPGLFIRGDNAIWLMIVIQQLGERLMDHADQKVQDLMDRLMHFAKTIEQEVKAN